MVARSKVTGKKHSEHSVMLFALSTCVWCRKTKRLLDSLDISYEFIYVNELSGKDEAEITQEMEKVNPDLTFPTLVVDNDRVIVGFKQEQIMRALS